MAITDTRPASEKQIDYAKALLRSNPDWESKLDGQEWETAFDITGGPQKFVAKSEASQLIDALKALTPANARRAPSPALAKLPLSKFALQREGDRLLFLEVREWKGNRFVNLLYGAPKEWRRERVTGAHRETLVRELAQDPAGAIIRFATKFTCCARCGSPLSHEDSRAIGLGPDCRAILDR